MRGRLIAILSCSCLPVALTVFSGVFVFGQSVEQKSSSAQAIPAAKQNDIQTDALRVTARLVQISVIAQDLHGRPVADLTKDDFTVLDRGKPQKITSFAPLTGGTDVLNASAATPTRDFSNRAESEQGAAPSVTVILLDFVNTSLKDFSYAQTQVLKFARQTRPEDQVAIYLLTPSSLDVLHDFTNDADTLAGVMSGPKHSPNSLDDERAAAASAAYKRMNDAVGDAFTESYRFFPKNVDKPRVTSWAMQTIAKGLTAIPGRKNLVWIAGTFPVNLGYVHTNTGPGVSGASFTQTLSPTAKALSDANIYVYPVEARGPSGEDTLTVLRGHPINTPAPELSSAGPNEKMFQAMNISEAIRTAIDDSRESYSLGYYPDHDKWDGTFREIKVKVNRPGITLRYRGGYFASAEGTDIAAQKKLTLVDAIRSPVPLIGLELQVHAEPLVEFGNREMKVNIRVSPEQMHFEHIGDRWIDSVEVVWAALSADSRVVARGEHSFGVKPEQSGYEEIVRDGLAFSEHASVPSEAVELRLVVRESGSGATGTVNIPLARLLTQNSAAAPVKK